MKLARIAAMSLALVAVIAGGVTIAVAGSGNASASITKAQAVAYAHSVNLRESDLPGAKVYSFGEQFEHSVEHSPGAFPDEELGDCSHQGKVPSRRVGGAASALSGGGYPFVASVVLVMRSEAFAKTEVAALSTARGRACLARQLGRVESVEGEKKLTSFAAKVIFVPVTKTLGPGAIALRVLAELPPAHEKDERQSKATFTHVDAAIFRVGPAEIFFLTFGVRPFPPATENRLLTLLHSRAEANKLS
jgi:hypothetical protein